MNIRWRKLARLSHKNPNPHTTAARPGLGVVARPIQVLQRRLKKQADLFAHRVLNLLTRLTLPNDEYFPSELTKPRLVDPVAGAIAFQLRFPEPGVGLGDARELAVRVFVQVPEAAMHEDHFLSPWEHEIGRARKIAPVQPVPVSHAMHQSANIHLGLGVLCADAAH